MDCLEQIELLQLAEYLALTFNQVAMREREKVESLLPLLHLTLSLLLLLVLQKHVVGLEDGLGLHALCHELAVFFFEQTLLSQLELLDF